MSRFSGLRESEVLKKGGVYVFSSGFSQAVMLGSWLVLPWALSTVEIGQFALVSFGIDLMTRFILLGMDAAVIRFLVEPERRAEVLRAVHTWLGIGVVVVGIGAWATRDVVPHLLSALSPLYADVVWLMFAAAAATALTTIVFSHYIATGAATQYAKLAVLRSVLIGGGYVATAFAGLGVPGLVTAQLLAALVVVASSYVLGNARVRWQLPDGATLREVAAYGLPMTAYSIVGLLNDYLGRLLIGWKVSINALGVFQFYYQIAVQANGLWASLNRAWTPYVFQLLGKSRAVAFEQIKRGLVFGSALYAGGLVLGMMAGIAGLWGVVFAPSMAGRIELLYVLLLGPLYTAIYTAWYPAFYYHKNTVRVSVVQSVVSIGTMLVTVYLTIQLASLGAALAWVFGSFITPIAYFAGFPRLRAELRPMAAALAIWGLGGTLTVVALFELHSTLLAATVLAASTAGVLAWRAASTSSAEPAAA